MLPRTVPAVAPTACAHARPSASLRACLAVGLALLSTTGNAQVRRTRLDELLFKANQYVVAYQQQFSGLVAEERYTQRVHDRDGRERRVRTLVSDYLLVGLTGDSVWRSLRDVREVDGAPVRDREARLLDLFMKPGRSVNRQVTRLLDESARYNIGNIERDFNQPILPLIFLDPLYQHRFTFSLDEDPSLEPGTVHVVSFVENTRPTMIQLQSRGRSIFGDTSSSGRFWLDVETGRVVKSELVVGARQTQVNAVVTVTYRPNPTLDLWVPVTMDERYMDPTDDRGEVITGHAEYGNYRAFTVSTDVSIK